MAFQAFRMFFSYAILSLSHAFPCFPCYSKLEGTTCVVFYMLFYAIPSSNFVSFYKTFHDIPCSGYPPCRLLYAIPRYSMLSQATFSGKCVAFYMIFRSPIIDAKKSSGLNQPRRPGGVPVKWLRRPGWEGNCRSQGFQ